MNDVIDHSQFVGEKDFVRDPSYPCPRDMVHVSIFSGANYAAMLQFYQIVLNMRIAYEINGKIRFTALSFDEENHRIGLVEIPSLAPRTQNTVRIEHSSWRYKSLGDALATVRRVESELGLFPMAVHQGTLISISYKDPDANRCELIVECLSSQADITDFYVATLAENPDFNTLMPFDLRKMLSQEEAGEPAENMLSYEWVRDHLPASESAPLF